MWVDADTHLPAGLLRAALDRLAEGRTVGGGSVVEMDGPQGRLVSGFVRLWTRIALRWGRKRGLTFEVLVEHPAVTSQRKTEWYGAATILGVLLLITVFPFLILSRRFCFMWYRRPGAARSA